MTAPPPSTEADARLERLLGFLERDPANPSLLADAASAALAARDAERAASLIDRVAQQAPLPPPLLNLRAVIAMARKRFAEAVDDLRAVLELGGDDPAIRFNLAWSLAQLDRFEEAERYLDADAIAASPRGPSLKILALHHLDRHEEALEIGAELAERYPHDEALMGALATLAMDADREDLARTYAARAGDNPEGLVAQGLFALEGNDAAGAMAKFDRALDDQADNPRAWIGKGLAMLAADPAHAAAALDRGATLFADHLGSWVAAGWAHLIAGDLAEARDRFERVVAIDATFSEGHGGLAVIDVLEGKLETAKRNSEVAARLDRSSMSGALARSLLLQAEGNPAAAERVREAAMNVPVGPGGKTLAQLLAASASGLLKRR